MNWFFFALIAQIIAASAVIFDKLIFKRLYRNTPGYAFWMGILGLSALALIPFGAHLNIPLDHMGLALLTGLFFLGAMFTFFAAIFKGETSSEAILIAALSPIFTLVFNSALGGGALDTFRLAMFTLLVVGGIILFFVERRSARKKTVAYALISALLFGLSYSFTKLVFTQDGFLTGFLWIKIGAAAAALLMLAIPVWRKSIAASHPSQVPQKPVLYVLNRAYAGLGSIVLYYATSLGPAPLVNATDNIKFLFLFLGGWLLLHERFKGWVLAGKIAAILVLAFGIAGLAGAEYYATHLPDPARPIAWGVTFSQKYATNIGLDWKETYNALLDDLKPRYIRLVAYWDLIEPSPNTYKFEDLDYQIRLAQEHGTQIVLAIGQRVPRWPECHVPEWISSLTQTRKNDELLAYERALLEHYKSDSFRYLQIENEPFLAFGNCPELNTAALDAEIALAKDVMPSSPILMTDGGEFGTWYRAAERGDAFGTTMYRRVHSATFGYFDYHLPPEFFRLKESLTKWIVGKPNERYIVAELAAEPWLIEYPTRTALETQLSFFDIDFFKSTISYAKLSGFDEYYLWGSEWWYWMKKTQNRPEFWNYAKQILSSR